MSKIAISVHPLIKKIIQNLDLDLGAELHRYEKQTLDNGILIPELIEGDSIKVSSSSHSSSSLVYTPTVEEEEPIPVASRLISNEDKSLLDLILTPWGVFGIIIFFGTNIFIFLGLNNINYITEYKEAKIIDQGKEEKRNINQISNQVEENQSSFVKENENNILPPPLPSALPTVENLRDTNNLLSSPYPDLKTALMMEINKNNTVVNQSSLIQPPPPLMEQMPSPLVNNPSNLNNNYSNNLSNNLNNNHNNNPDINLNNNSVNQHNINLNNNNTQSSLPVRKDMYFVMANYENMSQFNNIKKLIPNALITNIGGEMKIQLGVFKTEGEARTKSQEWQKKGINTFINEQ